MTIKAAIVAKPDTAHLEQMAQIHRESFTKHWDTRALAEMLSVRGTHAFVAGDAGFAILRILDLEAELLTIAVSPDRRGQGVGVALMQAMHAFAGQRGAKAVFLEVSERNEAACKLYTKAGFSEISRRKAYYHESDGSVTDARVMRAPL